MEKEDYERNADTGKIELERIMKFLVENGFELTDVNKASRQLSYSVAEFKKDISYTDKTGNWINDRHIKISIEFDDAFDHKNIVREEEKNNKFNREKSKSFVEKLIDNSY